MKHNEILIGNFTCRAALLREYLKGFDYTLVYEASKDCVTFSAEHPDSPSDPLQLIVLRTVPYETAAKFAELLDLVPRFDKHDPTHWISRVRMTLVQHDGTRGADAIVNELRRLKLPYFIYEEAPQLRIKVGGYLNDWLSRKHKSGSLIPLLEAIQSFARVHGKLPEEKKVA